MTLETVTLIVVRGPWNLENGAPGMGFDARPKRQFVTVPNYISRLA